MIRHPQPLFVLAVLCTGLATAEIRAQSLFMQAQRTGTYRGLIEDNTARHVGDILTIRIKEEHKVSQEDKTERESSSSLTAQIESFNVSPDTFGSVLPDLDIRSARSSDGQAKQQRDQDFEARIAVVVKDRLPNGNLVVVGNRTIIIDDEEKVLQVSGVIRIADIKNDNTIDSDQVAEAKVAIRGKGKNTEAVTKGPIGQLLETAWWLVWPF